MIRVEKAVPGGPTYPDYDHIHITWEPGVDPGAYRDWFETEALHHLGHLVVHLGLDSMSDFVVVDLP